MHFAVIKGAVPVPAVENGQDGPPELIPGVGGEGFAAAFADHILEVVDKVFQVLHSKLGIVLYAPFLFQVVDDLLKGVVVFLGFGLEPEDHTAVHLYEPPVGVPGKPFVAGFLNNTLHGVVIEPQVQDGVHHPRHGNAGTGTDRQQQRVVGIPEFGSHCLFNLGDGRLDIFLDQ